MTKARRMIGLGVVVLGMLAVLLSLGVWQLQRRVEKQTLIAALDERLAAAPVPLPPRSEWAALNPQHDEFRRVRFAATFEDKPQAAVYSSGSAIRPDVSGPGVWAFAAADLAGGEAVVINRGFVSDPVPGATTAAAIPPPPAGAIAMTGYLRFRETARITTPSHDAGRKLWFIRDHQAMARTHDWGSPAGEVAPFYIDLESPAPAGGVPKPGPLQVKLKDDHLQYAITWFGLALVVAAAFGFWLAGQRRE